MGVLNRMEFRDLVAELSGRLNYLEEGTITALVKYNALKPHTISLAFTLLLITKPIH